MASGKTTYAINHASDEDEIIDFDKIVKECNITDNRLAKQITLDLLEEAIGCHKTYWFITTIPNIEEQALLDKTDVKYLWLNTDLKTTINNIKHRNRYNEVQDIDKMFIKNIDILSRSDKYIMEYNAELINNY